LAPILFRRHYLLSEIEMIGEQTQLADRQDATVSAVSWGAIFAGAIANAALTLALIAFGVGMGFSTVNPWSGSGPSASTFKIGTGIYLCVVAILASTVGGYIAGRLRKKWTNLHTDEVVFRDTAHGFLTWSFAAVLGASLLGAATSAIVGTASAGAGIGVAAQGSAQATESGTGAGSHSAYYVDTLLRSEGAQTQAPTDPAAQRAEVTRIFAYALREGGLSPTDRGYLARLVSARTGLSQPDAERRVDETTNAAKQALDDARRGAGHLALWLCASMLLGAFAASLAAIEGGQLRDGVWDRTFRGRRPRTVGAT
jgi:hypothetical protein